MSVCVFSIKYVIDKKLWKFLLCVAIATAIHFSAIFWVVAFFACNSFTKKSNFKLFVYIVFAIVGYFTVDIFQDTTSAMFDRWAGYSNIETNAAGFISFAIFALITFFVFENRKEIISYYPYANVMININYLNMILWIMRLITRNTERISFYFTIAPILLVPVLCQVVKKKYGNVIGSVVQFLIVVSMVILFWTKATKDPKLYPYMFMDFALIF